MTSKNKDIIIVVFTSIVPAIFFGFLGYCDYADYRSHKNGELCECRYEHQFEYTDFFIKVLFYIISGVIMFLLRRLVNDKERNTLYRILFGIILFIDILVIFV